MIPYTLETFKDFFLFIRNPYSIERIEFNKPKFAILDFLVGLILCLLGGAFASFLIALSSKFIVNGETLNEMFLDNRHKLQAFQQVYKFEYFIAIVIFIGPLIEEIGYRLYLRVNPLFISISLFIILLTNFTKVYLIPKNLSLYNFLITGICFCMAMMTFFFLNKNRKVINYLKNPEGYKILFYFSALSFGFFHLHNFNIPISLFYLAPLLVLPQIFYGFIFGYFRLKRGLFFSLILHCTLNLIGFIPTLIVHK